MGRNRALLFASIAVGTLLLLVIINAARSRTAATRPESGEGPVELRPAHSFLPAQSHEKSYAKSSCVTKPSACGYPDSTNTGIPVGTQLTKSGSIDASTDGQVIDSMDINGEVNVTASNVLIKNSRITGGRGTTGPADWVVVVRPSAVNLTIVDSEILTPAGIPQDIGCVLNIGSSSPMLLRVNIHGCSAGVSSGAGLVVDSYIHDMSQIGGLSHDVGVASNGGGGLTVRHNTVLNQLGQTAAVALYQDFGVQRDDLIEDNLLAGGGYCVYGGSGTKGATLNIKFLNNRFSNKYHATCGGYGVVASFNVRDVGNEWNGNFWDDTLRPVNLSGQK